MIELLIKYHKKIFSNDLYEFMDPNFKLNSVNEHKPTQDEIIQGIKENNLNNIEIKYFGDHIIKYTQMNENKIKFSPMEPNSVHLLRLISLKQLPKYSFDFDIEVQKENLN